MNATLAKFGYPDTLIHEYAHWCVLLRPAQVTLGSLVLGAKSEARSFAEIGTPAFAELPVAVGAIERGLRSFRPFDRINYLMLMMVDPHVHFHVIPRYEKPQTFGDLTMADAGWPGPPDLKSAMPLYAEAQKRLCEAVRETWIA